MRIAVTGHRPDKLGYEYDMVGPYSDHIRRELQQVIDSFSHINFTILTRMAIGVDAIWALLAISNGIPFHAYVPFKGQELKWPAKSQILYHQILAKAEKIIYCSPPPYSPAKMQIGNEMMVNDCTLLVSVWDGTPGGTANCTNYADAKGTPILKIDPNPKQNGIS